MSANKTQSMCKKSHYEHKEKLVWTHLQHKLISTKLYSDETDSHKTKPLHSGLHCTFQRGNRRKKMPCLPCLCTKANPDSTWNRMFLISFSENILFSLTAQQRNKGGKEKRRNFEREKVAGKGKPRIHCECYFNFTLKLFINSTVTSHSFIMQNNLNQLQKTHSKAATEGSHTTRIRWKVRLILCWVHLYNLTLWYEEIHELWNDKNSESCRMEPLWHAWKTGGRCGIPTMFVNKWQAL